MAGIAQIKCLGVLADNQFQFDIVQGCQQVIVPGLGTFSARWQVTAFAFAGIAEAHGYDSKIVWVVERVAVNTEPEAQAFTTGVIKGDAFAVSDLARGLTGDKNSGFGVGLNNRARAERQPITDLTLADRC